MNKAFKYRIYPNKSQKELLSKTFGCIRVIWNANNVAINMERVGVDILYNRTQRDEVTNPVEAFKME